MEKPEDTVNAQPQSRPATPPAPPYSPVTPVMSHSTLFPPPPATDSLLGPSSSSPVMAPQASQSMPPPSQAPVFAPEPDPVPISESENPDAIALRSALGILQMQRQQALRDIRKLDELKQTAVRDPEAFSRELGSGRLSSASGDILRPHPAPDDESEEGVDKDGEDGDSDEENMEVDGGNTRHSAQSSSGKFGKIPTPQNVIRMPPVNWAKYHIVGEPLEELHEEQRRRPSPGEPRRDTAMTQAQAARNPEHFVAAPYRPFVDRLEPGPTTKRGNKRKHDQT